MLEGCIDGLEAGLGVLLAVLALEVVVLAAAGGGCGEVEDLAVVGLEDVATLGLGCDRLEAVHKVRAGVDVVVAAEDGVDVELAHDGRELLAQARNIRVRVVGALGEEGVVHAHEDPVVGLAALGDGCPEELLVAGDVLLGASVGVEADEEHVVALEVEVADVLFLVGVEEVLVVVLEFRRGGVELVVAWQRVGGYAANLGRGEVAVVLGDGRAPAFDLVA